MADCQALCELLGLPNIHVLSYEIIGNERIEVQIRSSLEAALCPDCRLMVALSTSNRKPRVSVPK